MATLSTLTLSAGTNTVVTSFEHGITTGQMIHVAGTSNDTVFGGYFTATNITATSFSYDQRLAISAISRSGGVVTVTVTIPTGRSSHEFSTNESIVIAGTGAGGTGTAFDTGAGGAVITAVTATTFTYSQAGGNGAGTVSGSSFAYPVNASGTGGRALPVMRLTPSSIALDTGFTPTGTASELTAVTDNSDSTFIRAQDTFTRMVIFNLSNPPSSGTGSIQSNQDCGSAKARLRVTSTADSDFEPRVSIGSYTFPGRAVTDALVLTNLPPGMQNDAVDFYDIVPDLSEPWSLGRLNNAQLELSEWCSISAARASVYETWLDCYLWSKPYISGLAVTPTPPVTTTTRPFFTWTHGQADGLAQRFYEIRVNTALVADPTAASSTEVWASGQIQTSSTNVICGVDLTPGVTYYVYVRTGVRYGIYTPTYYGLWGSGTASSYTSFAVSTDSPKPASVSGSWDSSVQAVSLSVAGYGNLLTLDNASFEASAGTWLANSGSPTVARSTAQAFIGTASLAVTSPAGGGTVNARSGTGTASGFAVDPTVTYKLIGMSRAATAARSVLLGILWYNSGGTFLGATTTAPVVTNSTSGWTRMIASYNATTAGHPTARFAVALYEIQSTGSTETHYLDQVSVSPNSTGTTVTTNLIRNPSAEIATTNFSSSQTGLALSSVAAYVGTRSLRVTLSSTTDSNCFAVPAAGYGTPTTAAHTVSAYFYIPLDSTLAGQTITLRAEGGSGYTEGASSPATLVPGRWVRATRVITWSSTASLPDLVARIGFPGTGIPAGTSGQVLYSDGWMLHLGSSAVAYFDGDAPDSRWDGTAHGAASIKGQPYELGGVTGRTVTVQRSNDYGATWVNVRSITDATFSQATQTATGFDYEAARGQEVLYRTIVSGTDSGGNAVSSVGTPPAPTSVTTVNPANWWLKDPLVPANNMGSVNVQADSVSVNREEATGVFRIYGRSTAVVTAGAFTGEDGSLEIFATTAEWADLEPLLAAQRALLLQDPAGEQKYIRITQRSWEKMWMASQQVYRVSIDYVEVDAP